jgi:hypothetical protein
MDILASDSINLKSIKSVTEKVEEAKMEAKQAQNAAIEAAKTATDYMKFEEGVGLIVSKNAQSNEGASTVLTDDSLQIRKYGEKCAEFTDDRISFYGRGKKLVEIKSFNDDIDSDYTVKGASIDCEGYGAVNVFTRDVVGQGKHAALTATAGSYNPNTNVSEFISAAADLTAVSKSGVAAFVVHSNSMREDNVIASLIHSPKLNGILDPVVEFDSKGTIIAKAIRVDKIEGLYEDSKVSAGGIVWNVRKYADGTAIAEGEWSGTVSAANAWGPVYYSGGTSTALPPGLFIDTPLTSVEIEAPDGELWTTRKMSTKDYIGGIYYISMSRLSRVDARILYRATGRWK